MTELAFHVYDKDNKVVVHSLSVEELEKKLEEGKISTTGQRMADYEWPS